MTPSRRVLVGILLAAAFGVAAGFFKGDETGLRSGIGNLSAPWVLVAFIPARRFGTALRGAAIGLLSTLIALTGFYAALTVVLAGHLGGGGFLHEFVYEAHANRIYFVAGLLSGPVFGAAGAWVGSHRPRAFWLVVGALTASESVAVALAQGHQLSPAPSFSFGWAVGDWTPYIWQSALGIAIVLAAIWKRSRASTN
jgi:hypothetical protein